MEGSMDVSVKTDDTEQKEYVAPCYRPHYAASHQLWLHIEPIWASEMDGDKILLISMQSVITR